MFIHSRNLHKFNQMHQSHKGARGSTSILSGRGLWGMCGGARMRRIHTHIICIASADDDDDDDAGDAY